MKKNVRSQMFTEGQKCKYLIYLIKVERGCRKLVVGHK